MEGNFKNILILGPVELFLHSGPELDIASLEVGPLKKVSFILTHGIFTGWFTVHSRNNILFNENSREGNDI